VSISIKNVDEASFRNLKAEAVRKGLKVGQAASESFRLWVSTGSKRHLRDTGRMAAAAEDMDRLRSEVGKSEWSGVQEIRKWRDKRE
jgi:hypothetical protein